MNRVFEHNNQSWVGYTLGFTGCVGRYLMHLHINMDMGQRIAEAAFTSIICAILGKVAIDCYVWGKKKISNHFKK